MASDKHMAEAEETLDLVLCNGPEVPDYRAEAIKTIARALAKAERDGMKRAAEIAEAQSNIEWVDGDGGQYGYGYESACSDIATELRSRAKDPSS